MQEEPTYLRGDNAEGQTPRAPLGDVSRSPYSTALATKSLLEKPPLEAPRECCPHFDAGQG